jgi:hypothetical protein
MGPARTCAGRCIGSAQSWPLTGKISPKPSKFVYRIRPNAPLPSRAVGTPARTSSASRCRCRPRNATDDALPSGVVFPPVSTSPPRPSPDSSHPVPRVYGRRRRTSSARLGSKTASRSASSPSATPSPPVATPSWCTRPH